MAVVWSDDWIRLVSDQLISAAGMTACLWLWAEDECVRSGFGYSHDIYAQADSLLTWPISLAPKGVSDSKAPL